MTRSADRATAPTTREPLLRGARDRRALTVMSVAHGIQHFYVGGLAVSYPFVVAQFHVSYAVLGVVLTIAGLLGGLLQGSAGLLRRASARAIITAQDAGIAASSLLAAFAPGFGVFAAARVLGNAVSWPQHPVGSAYLSDRFPHRRATVLSWHTAGGSIGTVVVPLFLSAIIAAAGWRVGLIVLGAILLAGAIVVRLALPAEPRSADHADEAGAATSPPTAPLRQVLLGKRVVALLIASTVAAGGRGLGVLTTYVPAYLRSGLHLPTLTVGALFTAVLAASVAGPVIGGMLADRFGRVRTLVVTYAGGAAALLAFGYAGSNVGVLAVLGVCVGVLAYTESPLLQAVFSDLTRHGRARSAFGAFFAISFGVGSLWTAVIGWIITAAGFGVAFAVMAGSFVAAAAVVLVFVRD
ncbi:MAG: MFS transporter [Actinobacteria bacterium]|nr:MFS transporter [Actinomycetota bacterium]